MAGGRLTLVSRGATRPMARAPAASRNIVYKRPKAKRRFRRKPKPARSYKLAYRMLAPKKEIRYNFTDVAMSSLSTVDAWIITPLTSIIQGSQINQRSQSGIHTSYVHWKGSIQNNSTLKPRFFRMVILRDARSDGNILDSAALTNLLVAPDFTDNTFVPTSQSLRKKINRAYYQVYFEKVVVVPPEAQTAKYFNYKIRVNTNSYYPRADGASVTPLNGKIYAIVMLMEGDNVTSSTDCVYSSEIIQYFKDTEFNTPYYRQ